MSTDRRAPAGTEAPPPPLLSNKQIKENKFDVADRRWGGGGTVVRGGGLSIISNKSTCDLVPDVYEKFEMQGCSLSHLWCTHH